MGNMSAREHRQFKKDAAEFGRTAQAGRTYYYINEGAPKPMNSNGRRMVLLQEIVFEPASRTSRLLSGNDQPRWYGPRTATDAYLQLGPLYADRNDPAIRGLLTDSEYRETYSDDELHDAMEAAALGTNFWVTSPHGKTPKPEKQRALASSRR